MAGLRPLCSELPQLEPYASVQPADLHDGEKFLDGAIRGRTENSKLPPMRLRYGHIMVESQYPYADSEKQEVIDCSPEVEADVVGGEEEKNGDRIFEIYFSQNNRNYLVTLVFRPEDRSDGDDDEDSSYQEEEEEDQLGSDYYYSDDEEEEEETYKVEQDQQICYNQELTGKRTFDLYFQAGLQYVVRFVFEKVEEARFLEEEVEFLFSGLQRIVGISHDSRSKEDQDQDEIPAPIDDKSSCVLSELVESEISRKSMEKSDETEDGENLSRIIESPIPETETGGENEIGAESADQSSGNFVDLDHLKILERKNYLVARIVRDHLQLHSSV